MALTFKPKPGKPHIKIRNTYPFFYLWPSDCHDENLRVSAVDYCMKVNHGKYDTLAEAARALHYGSTK
jgi:hypothetical protein